MALKPFQERVVDEKATIDVERIKLDVFLNSPHAQELPVDELALLVRQKSVMAEYSDILAERIGNFTGDAS